MICLISDKKTIVVGITGSIAAYKAADLVSRLKKHEGFTVRVIMTKAATEFIAPLTLETLSGQPVIVDMFNRETPWEVEHISLAKAADVMVIAPATANIIGKLAGGIADDMLSTTVMATKSPVLIAPAMNSNMYTNPVVQSNMDRLKERGYTFVEPRTGMLACGIAGVGKLAPVDVIHDSIMNMLTEKDLKGKSVLVTAGPTREPIDPVRYISNRSSGKMGYAIAGRAAARGADVTLVTGPVQLPIPNGVRAVKVQTTEDMLNAVMAEYEKNDIIIKAAAPADYLIKDYSKVKIKKTESELELKLSINPDIAAELGRKKGGRFLVIFAAETDNAFKNGLDKLERKNADLIVINDVSREGAGFEVDTNIVSIVDREGAVEHCPMMSKQEVADHILDAVLERL